MNKKTKQKWRRLDAEGVKLFKEMLIMFSYRVDNPESKLWRVICEECTVKIYTKVEYEFYVTVSFNKEEDDYEMLHTDVVKQSQEALKAHGINQHPLHAVKTMTDLWKLYSKEVK